MCEGKTVYESFDEALKSIKVIQSYKRNGSKLIKRRNKTKQIPLKPYKCPDCNKWHLTSQK